MIFAFMVLSYILIFFCGRFWQWEKDKTKTEELQKAQRKFRTYDREGRIGQ